MQFYKFKKKLNGYFLLEVLLGMTIASGLFLTIYKAYDSIIKSVSFLKGMADLNSEKVIFHYNLKRDLASLYFPIEIDKIFDIAKKENSKKEKDLKESDEKKNKNRFEDYLKYFPILKNENENIILEFYSTREIFKNENSRSLSKIKYKFSLRNDYSLEEEGKKIKIYTLSRSEKIYSKNDQKKEDKDKDYEILEFVRDPKITFIYSKIIKGDENKKSEKIEKNLSSENSEKKKMKKRN